MDLGSTVTLVYTGTLEDGTVFGYATEENPMVFQTGMDMAIDGFEKEILAMEGFEGEKKTFTVGQYEAYGEYLDDYVVVIPTHQIPKRDIKVGSRLWMANDEGEPTLGTVIEIEGGNAKFDLNHPLAGKDLTFEVEIKSVEAAPENFVSEHEKRQHMKEQSKLLGGDQGESYR
ncbi:FKBP-type peptidyl-prolyl cis-trans isomerase [Ellagibacter isourolithinifaciens]|mgnify:FL=1|uniref:FKBP-type peptidyl-prolyl cis-trans isomerase n=1 Tax=Ellagibacter isourolithinifaciens TaxID=2137581 RepID=UPI003A956491